MRRTPYLSADYDCVKTTNYQRTVLSNVHCWKNVETRVFTLLPFKRARRLNRKMLFFGVLSLLLVAVSAETCYNQMVDACGTKIGGSALKDCTAEYGAIAGINPKLQGFANANMLESLHLLLISGYFGNYEVNREGFKKLYRQYSDKLWEDSIDVMKYIAKRGGQMNFEQPSHLQFTKTSYEELQSLALVLDKQKELAKQAFEIHTESRKDPALAHYVEERFLEPHTERIRQLAGYITELKDLSVKQNNTSVHVSVFLFDEYLQKSL